MASSQLRAVVFDVDFTIARPGPDLGPDGYRTLGARYGLDLDPARYEEARIAFLQAYTLKKHPAVLLNLAQSSARSNHPLEAAKYFQQFLREATTATPAQKKDAENGLAEVRQKIGRIDVVAPSGTEISLDDQGRVGTTPSPARALSVARRPSIAPGSSSVSGSCSSRSRLRSTMARG